jgi:class 3 adenylate cyclase
MNPDIIVRTETLTSHKELYFLLKVTSGFMLFLYSCLMIFEIYVSKIKDRNSIGLSFIYIKHILDILITPHMTIMQYEMSRVIMWSFTTPLMLKMLSDENELTLSDLQINYHILAIVPHIFIIPFKNQYVYMGSTILLSIPGFLFMRTLYKYKHLHFANLYLLIWGLFMVINLLDVTQLFDPILIHALYNLADTIFKFVFNFVIANYNEHENIIRDNMDLQSVNFVSTMINCIKQFENNNKKLTPFCGSLIKYLNKKCMNKIPKTDSRLKLELLQKILPFNFDKDYVDKNMRPGTGAVSGTSKKFDFICVMFMDIVNYTELAKKYDEDIIFKLLDAVYHCFDTLIKKYSHLQKIETIGDAYFVVGDIYREELNHKIVVKEIILLAMEFIKEVKHIITPDGVPLCIRIGINIGAVSVGILGNEIPRLCVVGNTVNMASRLQSTADSDTIQLSRHIYEHAEDTDFGFPIEFIEKDNIFLKNIGSVVTYNISREPTVPPYAPSLKH